MDMFYAPYVSLFQARSEQLLLRKKITSKTYCPLKAEDCSPSKGKLRLKHWILSSFPGVLWYPREHQLLQQHSYSTDAKEMVSRRYFLWRYYISSKESISADLPAGLLFKCVLPIRAIFFSCEFFQLLLILPFPDCIEALGIASIMIWLIFKEQHIFKGLSLKQIGFFP